MIKTALKVAKVALVGYIAYKAVTNIIDVDDEKETSIEQDIEHEMINDEQKANLIKIAGGIAVVYLLIRHHRLANQVEYVQTMAAANRFNAIITADKIGMFDGPDRLRILDSNLKTVKEMTGNPAIRRAVKDFSKAIHFGYGGELHV